MIRLLLVCLLALMPLRGAAQELSGLARLDVAQSRVAGARDGGLTVDLWLSQPVPWRVFTLDDPRRLVVDFREIDWRGASKDQMRAEGAPVSDLRFGVLRPGWSRMVLDLAAPQKLRQAGMEVDPLTGTARLQLETTPVSPEAFAQTVGAPEDPAWAALAEADPTASANADPGDGVLVVAIDPGHGGIDPGASRDGVEEADVMLALGLELAEALSRQTGIRPVLTRSEDVFVPLEERMTIARSQGAELFLSLHADALELDQAAGASIYVLSETAREGASQRMAERHSRGDLLAGVDLSGQDDTLALVLMDLARARTAPQSARLQQALLSGLGQVGARLTARPERSAKLAVLMSADFPSVLIEAGFLSNAADRAALQSSAGRAPLVAGIVRGVRLWQEGEAQIPALGGQ
ncbi:MAG: N-acetylmuramoyl-L-alanine amidase [Rhodobacterales bacterium]|nr:MAG: N-acetylmuramoyl-L-alanine amidase [Rhodobacterales bacterium]